MAPEREVTILVETVVILKQPGLWVSVAEAIAVAVAAVAAERILAGDGTLGEPAVAVLLAETFSGAPVESAAAWRYQGNDVYPCERVCLWRGGWSTSFGE